MSSDYAKILFIQDLPRVEKAAFEWLAILEADGAVAAAAELRAAYFDLYNELGRIGRQIAVAAKVKLDEEERSTRVRPRRGVDEEIVPYLEVDHLATVPGSIGIVNKKVIDDSPAHWWWTNEIGYSGFIGREIQGYFFDSGWGGRGVPPDSGHSSSAGRAFRAPSSGPAQEVGGRQGQHPLFGPVIGGPSGTIHNPIPARRFVLRTIEHIEPIWREKVIAAQDRFMEIFNGATRRYGA